MTSSFSSKVMQSRVSASRVCISAADSATCDENFVMNMSALLVCFSPIVGMRPGCFLNSKVLMNNIGDGIVKIVIRHNLCKCSALGCCAPFPCHEEDRDCCCGPYRGCHRRESRLEHSRKSCSRPS